MSVDVSFALAFAAGVVSFLSPCILPVVPSYLAFMTGLTLDELGGPSERPPEEARAVRRRALAGSVLFMVGFGAVFMSLGWAATSFGRGLTQALPWLSRLGGAALIVFGLHLTGLVRIPGLGRERGVHLERRPAGPAAALLVGIAFGAGWTPCIGPILASILLYAGLEATRLQGTLLLGTYAVGLGIPFIVASVAFNWFLAGADRVRTWIVPLQRAAGAVLVLVGVMMLTGTLARLTTWLAGMGQLITLEMQ